MTLPAVRGRATRSKDPSYRSRARRRPRIFRAGSEELQAADIVLSVLRTGAHRIRAPKTVVVSTSTTTLVAERPGPAARRVAARGAASRTPRARMGSGASKGAAPKGGKRKKNDPRAQLERLVQSGNVRGVADLLSKKTELTNSALDDKSGTRAIHIACKNGDRDMIRELMKRNCFLNQKDAKGTTALMLAAAAGHDKIVKLIVDSGADVRMKDKNDDTALEYAEKNNRTKVKELLNLYACEYTW